MSFIIVSYYTENTLYEDHAKTFEKSLLDHNIPFKLKRIRSLGTWEDNVNHKPTFLKMMLKKYARIRTDIVWVDCDAVFQSYPSLFDDAVWDFAVHVWNRKRSRVPEVMSGTVFLHDCQNTRLILDAWERECKKNPEQWDQRSLAKVLERFPYDELPMEYCKIFDKMENVTDPVIIHNQASRVVRQNKGRLI